MDLLTLKVKRHSEFATLPSRESERAAGYDLYAAYSCVVPAKEKSLIETDISVAVPQGMKRHYYLAMTR
jgi:dUTP pyrophosphatase